MLFFNFLSGCNLDLKKKSSVHKTMHNNSIMQQGVLVLVRQCACNTQQSIFLFLYLSLLLLFLSCVTMISKDRSYSSLTPHALSAFIMFPHSIIQVVLSIQILSSEEVMQTIRSTHVQVKALHSKCLSAIVSGMYLEYQ